MCHVTHECVMSHINESIRITYVGSLLNVTLKRPGVTRALLRRNKTLLRRNKIPWRRYRARLQRHRAFWRGNRNLLRRYRALVRRYRAHFRRNRALLRRHRACFLRHTRLSASRFVLLHVFPAFFATACRNSQK